VAVLSNSTTATTELSDGQLAQSLSRLVESSLLGVQFQSAGPHPLIEIFDTIRYDTIVGI